APKENLNSVGQQGGVSETRSSRPPRAKPELHQRACRAQRPGGFSVLVTFAQRLGSRPQLLGVQGRGQAAVDSGMSDRCAEGRAGRERMVAFFLLFLCLLGLREGALLWTPYVSRLKLLRVEDGGPGTDYQHRRPCGAQIPGANSSAPE
ncbi:hypothetical protein DBR06_SOUSAS14010186, partial [Sousa chinensis]